MDQLIGISGAARFEDVLAVLRADADIDAPGASKREHVVAEHTRPEIAVVPGVIAEEMSEPAWKCVSSGRETR